MTDAKVDLGAIGWFSLVGLPYTLKFLWSPLLDSIMPPFLGRRRGWLVITQVGLILAIAAMALQQPAKADSMVSLQFLAANALLIAVLSASQDIAGDAYRTDVLQPQELGIGASTWVLGYRLAILVSGSFALILADKTSWQNVYLIMAGLMLTGLWTSFWAPDPPQSCDRLSPSLADAVYLPFKEFFARLGVGSAGLVLLFIMLYRVTDALVGNMAITFLREIGFTQTTIGAITGTSGFLAITLGVIGGGLIVTKWGVYRSLWIFGVFQALSNLAYFLLVFLRNQVVLTLAIATENFCAGLVTAAFMIYLMGLCNHRFTATQYALLSSLMAVSNTFLSAPAGELAKAVGWENFFLISLVAALPGLLLLPFVAPWNQQPPPIPSEAMAPENQL
jgi:PAT family beta-lactamase induction signal transducer AmpG